MQIQFNETKITEKSNRNENQNIENEFQSQSAGKSVNIECLSGRLTFFVREEKQEKQFQMGKPEQRVRCRQCHRNFALESIVRLAFEMNSIETCVRNWRFEIDFAVAVAVA